MNNYIKKIIIVFCVSASIGILTVIIIDSMYYAPTDEVTLPESIESKITRRAPAPTVSEPIFQKPKAIFTPRLTIPTIGVNAKIQDVGISRKGNMSTPNNFFDVGLYKYGPLPGDRGSAVIDGHVDNGFGFKAVFGNLKNIKIGDEVYVEMNQGVKIRFTVVSTQVLDYNADASSVFAEDSGDYLKLITCTGTWMPEFRTHDKRLIVTTVRSDL